MKAAEMLTPNDAIIIASGTTVLAFARCIPPEAQLTVLTSAMNVAMALLNCQQVEVIQLGGIVRHTSSSVTGEYALRMLENFSGTKLFLGVDGIDLKYGLTTTNFMEASVNRAMIDAAQKIIVLTDLLNSAGGGLERSANWMLSTRLSPIPAYLPKWSGN